MVAEQIRVLQTKSLLGMKRLVVCSFDWKGCNGYTEGYMYIAMYQKDRERVAAKAGRGGGGGLQADWQGLGLRRGKEGLE